jgi:hypothetical protein
VEQQATAIALRIEGMDQLVLATPRPEDQERLAELMGGGPIAVALSDEDDTEGHALSSDIVLDVEGHAIAVRLPTTADAAALRRGFAMGVVTASLVVAGAAAAVTGADMLSQAAASQDAPAAAPAAAPANDGIDSTTRPRNIIPQ